MFIPLCFTTALEKFYKPSSASKTEGKELGCTNVTAFVEIDLKDGRKLSGRNDYGKGSKVNPMSEEEVANKFRDCAVFADWSKTKTEEAIDLVQQFEELKDLRALLACLTRIT